MRTNPGRHRPNRPPKCPKQIQAPPTEMSGPATSMKLVTQSSDKFSSNCWMVQWSEALTFKHSKNAYSSFLSTSSSTNHHSTNCARLDSTWFNHMEVSKVGDPYQVTFSVSIRIVTVNPWRLDLTDTSRAGRRNRSRTSSTWRRSPSDLFRNCGFLQCYHRKMVVLWENHRKTIGKWWFYPLVNVYITMEKSTMLLMGKSTISMAIFNSKLWMFTRGYMFFFIMCWPLLGSFYCPNTWWIWWDSNRFLPQW